MERIYCWLCDRRITETTPDYHDNIGHPFCSVQCLKDYIDEEPVKRSTLTGP